MKRKSSLSKPFKSLFGIAIKYRRLLPKKVSESFAFFNTDDSPKIERIYVINLDRQPARLNEMKRELNHLLGKSGIPLWNLTERHKAVDAMCFAEVSLENLDINPIYTLQDQLFVEPQPLTLPTQMELNLPIKMSKPEIAVAQSHIEVWRRVLTSSDEYVLILEDDVWFRSDFTQKLDKAWVEIFKEGNKESFDILYLSYEEVKHGAPKTLLSNHIFCPVRGMWHLSGYVISRKGAEKLLGLLPCKGPIDLWINHQFKYLDVKAIKKSVISQRNDFNSTNSYSILPSLTKIGAITSESASLYQGHPNEQPVFAFGNQNSGLSSLAMALSMLGYRCCNDLQTLPQTELNTLLSGKNDCIFNAYVNIGSLIGEISRLKLCYPKAKFILTTHKAENSDVKELKILEYLIYSDFVLLDVDDYDKWKIICEHLKIAPPMCPFPTLVDLGQRQLLNKIIELQASYNCKIPKRDNSPWVIKHKYWDGIHFAKRKDNLFISITDRFTDYFHSIDKSMWLLRTDTFTDNLAIFQPENVTINEEIGVALNIRKETLGVREYSAGSITSCDQYIYGKFEAIIKASNVPGVVTGFFLHRDSPRQEIDVEISGNKPNRLLVNVFYNPGGEGVKYDYGYRGAASHIDLGFDASKSYHKYTIEWTSNEIKWYVDDCLVHKRIEWNPTPIPHLPMSLHVNAWPCRSRELAGRLSNNRLPSTTFIKSISLEANKYKN